MNKLQILNIINKYKDELNYLPSERQDANLKGPYDFERVKHILWMCDEIELMLKDEKFDKINRWLGFIQGVLWSMGKKTINEMREDNK